MNEGCSAVTAFIDHERQLLFIANLGKTRCLFGRNGKMISSKDHEPQDPVEFDRIERAGKVVFGNRIMGDLENSRGLGDHSYKNANHLSQEE